MRLNWNGKRLTRDVQAAALAALDEIDLRVEAAAKAELYPGHGKRTGMLQRSIQAEPARMERGRARGRIATKGVPYALRIHKLYQYMTRGVKKVRPLAAAILASKMRAR